MCVLSARACCRIVSSLTCDCLLSHAHTFRWCLLKCCGLVQRLNTSASPVLINSSTPTPHHCRPLSPSASPSPLQRRLRLLLLPRLSRHQRHLLRMCSRLLLLPLLEPYAVQLQHLPLGLFLPRGRHTALYPRGYSLRNHRYRCFGRRRSRLHFRPHQAPQCCIFKGMDSCCIDFRATRVDLLVVVWAILPVQAARTRQRHS